MVAVYAGHRLISTGCIADSFDSRIGLIPELLDNRPVMPQILVEHDPSPMKLEVLDVEEWPTVVEPVGSSEHDYRQTETSYIVEGEGAIKAVGEEAVLIGTGDLVTILPDTICTWTITKEIERHYSKG
jgi:uncharacterized cupin superfamily protein